MNQNTQLNSIPSICIVFLSMFSAVLMAETTFTYQGQLSQSGQAANGQYDMNFTLYDSLNAGLAVGSVIEQTDITVTAGVFNVLLDFGDAPFNNASRWLEIEVREAGGSNFTALVPRQRIGASPFAIETLFVAPGAVDTAAIQNGAVTEDKIADEAITLGKIDGNAVTSSNIMNNQVSSADIANDSIQRIDLQNDVIGTSQIENGTVLPEDIDGNVYNRKGSVYANTQTRSVGFGTERVTVSCTGARDLLINHVCNMPVDLTNLTVLSERLTSVDNDVNPARLSCSVENRSPTNAEIITATVWCLAVD